MTSVSATRFSLSETGQWWIVAGILFGLDLLVPFAAGGRASFHYAGSVPFNLVLAAGLIIAGVLLQALPFARFGAGMAIAMTAVIDCDLIGNLARLTTPDRAYGVGFWILGVSAIIATVATIVAFRRLRAEGQLEL